MVLEEEIVSPRKIFGHKALPSDGMRLPRAPKRQEISASRQDTRADDVNILENNWKECKH
jgi:hypothetical protein